MKRVLLKANSPEIVMLVGEAGTIREIVRTTTNYAGAIGAVPFNVTDYEYAVGAANLYLFENLTDDKYDDFRGTMSITADALAADGLKWYRIEFTRPRKTITVNSLKNALWFTFEDPYKIINDGGAGVRIPMSAVPNTQQKPYEPGTDLELIDQPLAGAAPGTLEYTYPKATYLGNGEGITIDLPQFSVFVKDVWARPVGIEVTIPATTADIFVYAF